jgi:hypothetical protein
VTRKEHPPGDRRYANLLRIKFNEEEFVMDFGQFHEGDDEAFLHTGIVATPQVAKVFRRILDESTENWDREFGSRKAEEPHDKKPS